jgi:hypothetical protein
VLGGVLTAVLTAALRRRCSVPARRSSRTLTGLYAPLPYCETSFSSTVCALRVGGRGVCSPRARLRRVAARAGSRCAGRGVQASAAAASGEWRFHYRLAVVVLVQRTGWNERGAAVLVPVLVLLVPTARHNRVASGRLVPVSVNGGINFFIGNNPDYDTTVGIRPGLRWEELTERFGSMDDPVAWQKNFYRASFDWMRRDPGAACALIRKSILAEPPDRTD